MFACKHLIIIIIIIITTTATTATVDRVVYRTDRHASVNLVCHSQHGGLRRREEKRTEQNLTVRSGKSEAEVTNKKMALMYCTIEAN